MVLMNDKEWESALEEQACESREALGRFKIAHNIQGDGTWTDWKETTIRMVRRTQVWYIMLADCKGNSHERFPGLPDIDIEIESLNEGSHFSQEQSGMLIINITMLASFCFFLGTSVWKLIGETKQGEKLEGPLTVLVLLIIIEVGQVTLEVINNLFYYSNGSGIWLISFTLVGWRIGS
jgi:hypothetical protein